MSHRVLPEHVLFKIGPCFEQQDLSISPGEVQLGSRGTEGVVRNRERERERERDAKRMLSSDPCPQAKGATPKDSWAAIEGIWQTR